MNYLLRYKDGIFDRVINDRKLKLLRLNGTFDNYTYIEVGKKDLGCCDWNNAKNLCKDNWRLPTKDELNIIYLNKDIIDGFAAGGGYYYWSSSEHSAYYAWFQYFSNGYQYYTSKANVNYVRAVRNLTIY